MKKLSALILFFVVVAVAASYIFIPSTIKISSIATVTANSNAVHRILMNDETWAMWWPYKNESQLQKINFKLSKKMLNSFEIILYDGNDSVVSLLQFVPVNLDTLNLSWSCELQTRGNPINRFSNYYDAVTTKKKLDFLIDSLCVFIADQKNIYGFNVKKATVTDSVLISTRKQFDHYPNEFETDEMIKKLSTHIATNNAKVMNYPMLHIKQEDETHFEAMVAIATDSKLPDNKEFKSKMLLMGGNLLESEITGGHATIRKAFEEYEQFIKDYRKTSPAIPYQLIITDRTKEKDTAKWITRLYYPII